MADYGKVFKNILTKSAKFVGHTATTAAETTKFKMNELGNISKRRELVNELGNRVYELARSGVALPSEVEELIKQISFIEDDLATLRAEHAAQKAADKAARTAEKTGKCVDTVETADVVDEASEPAEEEIIIEDDTTQEEPVNL